MAQPWPDGTEPGYYGNTEVGTIKPRGAECAREWPDGPPGHDYHVPPLVSPPDEPPPARPHPAADFTYTPANPGTQDNVTFDGSASVPSDGATLTAWNWLFNNQTTRSGVTCTWRLPSGHGSYDATLTVTDPSGQSDATTQVLVI